MATSDQPLASVIVVWAVFGEDNVFIVKAVVPDDDDGDNNNDNDVKTKQR